MKTFISAAVVTLFGIWLALGSASAAEHHRGRWHARHAAVPHRLSARVAPVAAVPLSRDDPYSPYAYPGAANRMLTQRNQDAPGLTNELAPDAKATASGGPVGGVPGFDGM